MAGYTLYTGGPYKQINGSAITASSTVIDKGTAKNVPDSENLTRSDWRAGNAETPTVVGGVDGVGCPHVSSTLTIDTIDQSNATEDLVQLTFSGNHGLVVGDIIMMSASETGRDEFSEVFYRVVRVVSTTDVVINKQHNTSLNGNTGAVFTKVGTFANIGAGNYTMKRVSANVHGQAETLMRSGGSDKGLAKVHYMRSARVSKVATAIRQGKYNIYSGEWQTTAFPQTANDYTSLDVDGTNVPDNESKALTGKREVGGAFSINAGGKSVQTKDYEAKTG